jgi:hypothetical protein
MACVLTCSEATTPGDRRTPAPNPVYADILQVDQLAHEESSLKYK